VLLMMSFLVYWQQREGIKRTMSFNSGEHSFSKESSDGSKRMGLVGDLLLFEISAWSFLLCYIIADLVTGKPIKMLMPVVPKCSSGTFEGREPVGNQLTQERWLPGKQNSAFF